MAAKNSKNKKQIKSAEETASKRQKLAQILFAAFALVLIISMVLSAVVNY